MNKNQKVAVALLILLIIVTIILCILKISSETTKNKDFINGNYYTKTTLKDAEFLGKFSYNSHNTKINNRGRLQSCERFKLLDTEEIIEIPCNRVSGHTGEKFVTIAIIDYYSKETNKHLYQKITIHEVKEYFDNSTDY